MAALRLMVTGAGGMVGSYVPSVFSSEELILTSTRPDYERLDVCDAQAVMRFVRRAKPDVVLHLAAATDVDRCEQQPDWAYAVNAVGTQNVALACQAGNAVMVHVSTAAVFAGDKLEPYTEYDAPSGANLYGRSKLAGEQAVAALLSRYYIVRTGWMIGGGSRDKKFVGKIVRLMSEGAATLPVVNDKFGNPTYAKDLLTGIRQLIGTGCFGLYHLANHGSASRFDIAVAIRQLLQRPEVELIAVGSERFPLPAPRGRSECLRNYNLELRGLDALRPWQEALAEYVQTELLPELSSGQNLLTSSS